MLENQQPLVQQPEAPVSISEQTEVQVTQQQSGQVPPPPETQGTVAQPEMVIPTEEQKVLTSLERIANKKAQLQKEYEERLASLEEADAKAEAKKKEKLLKQYNNLIKTGEKIKKKEADLSALRLKYNTDLATYNVAVRSQ